MKRLSLFLYLSISIKAIEPNSVDNSLEKALKNKGFEFLELDVPKEMKYVESKASSKFSFKLDGKCIERFGENIYDARAGVNYFFTSFSSFETGYHLVPTKMDTIEEINRNYIGLYGRFIFKF